MCGTATLLPLRVRLSRTWKPSLVVGIDVSDAAINAALWAADGAVGRYAPLCVAPARTPKPRRPKNSGWKVNHAARQ
jgi:hypothetical protein